MPEKAVVAPRFRRGRNGLSPGASQSPVASQAPLVFVYKPQFHLPPPKRRERAAILAKAKQEAVPLKVKLSENMSEFKNIELNQRLPVKKIPPYPEVCGFVTAALIRLDRSMPVGKRLSRFLFEEPPIVFPSPSPR